MQVVKKVSERITKTHCCKECEGEGLIPMGLVNTKNKGVMDFFIDCSSCDGTGEKAYTILKRKKA